jgi:FixJ family two-component response regulator
MEANMTELNAIVFVVDDDESTCKELSKLLPEDHLRIEAYENAHDFLARPRPAAPCCLVLDTSLPGLSGLELQARVAGERGEMPVIFTTSSHDIATTVRAMKAGAMEFLTKPIDARSLVQAVFSALDRSRAILDRDAELQALRACYDSLSAREKQVLALIVTGLMNKQVGGELGISEITVKAHRGRVMRKMRVRTLAELVNVAAKLRLSLPPKPDAMVNRSRAGYLLSGARI